ncbi:helix-turn-helix transcriptional regulator [Streptomyces sp. PTM05]|uniref:Helix-turn-helix transcriptional regulator n=1 Tax=Streptantibioticus parmotrematis TaxID=2873249 RepID=A0ABS7QTU6_9ACTN|nr:helix-turn-helix transcriptional regulator [Streptantibioticus parmotrematis]MBY8886615.1 helix-turn-helix transcriptional regulator [Streptantibioticus parmotrematis]
MAVKRHALVRHRRALGFTQESLAEALGVERSTVRRWESGESSPLPFLRPRLARLLRVGSEELEELLRATPETPSGQTERVSHALRHPSQADLVVAAELRSEMDNLTDRYDAVPSATLLADAGQQLNQVALLADEAPAGRVQRELRALQADAATLMGQLVWDASHRRDHETARAYYAQSLEVARHLRDPATEGHALLRTCYVALYGANDHRQGLELALQAALTTRGTSHALTGLALLHAAEAHAFLGEHSECERALLGAEKHLERSDGADAAHELFTPTHFGRLAGSCYLSLGDYGKAQRFLEETASRMQGRRKSLAIVLGNLALTAIRQGDLDAALAVFNEAVDELRGTRGGGGMNVVFRAARELRPWRGENAVQEAQDRLLALMEAA